MTSKMEFIPLDDFSAGSSARLAVIEGVQYVSIRDIYCAKCSYGRRGFWPGIELTDNGFKFF